MKLTVHMSSHDYVKINTREETYRMFTLAGREYAHGKYVDVPAVLIPGRMLVFGTTEGVVKTVGTVARVIYES